MKVSDGNKWAEVKHNSIYPSDLAYDQIFKRADKNSKGALLALELIDLNNQSNNRKISFDDNGNPQINSDDPQAYLILHKVNSESKDPNWT